MEITASRRTALKTIGTAALAGGALCVSERPAHADPGPHDTGHGAVDVLDHGAAGDGTTDDTDAFQSAIDAIAEAGGGTLKVPPKTYVLAPTTPVVLRADHMTVYAEGATFLRPYRNPRPSVMFVANTRGTPGYGAGVKGLQWYGGRFVGNLAEGNAMCPFGLHHAQHCVFQGITSENCHAPLSHQFDLCAGDDITITQCTFRGQQEDGPAGSEAIQVDQSYKGGLSGGSENVGFSGLPSRRITVEHCTFEPFTDEEGTVWPGPTPIGSHSTVEGKYYEDIRFAHNTVVDPRPSPLFEDYRDTWRGVVHFISVRGLEIVDNRFTMAENRQTRVIAVNSIDYGTVADASPSDPSATPKETWDVPNAPEGILIEDNVIEGFTVDPGVAEHSAIYATGLPGGPVRDLTIRGNTVRGGYQADSPEHSAAIEISRAEDVQVTGSALVDDYIGVNLTEVSRAKVRSNRIRNTTGTEFPAAITGRDVRRSSVRPGPTRGYRARVDIE